MRRWMPILLICFFSSANLSATESGGGTRALLERLVGTWDVRFDFTDKTGKVRSDAGQVRYGWNLAGRALQEVWTSNAASKELRPFGTTIDFYDPKRQRWTAIWIYPSQGMTQVMSGGEVNGGIVLAGCNEFGALERWSTTFDNPDSVMIRAEASKDEGKTWQPAGTSYLKRHRD